MHKSHQALRQPKFEPSPLPELVVPPALRAHLVEPQALEAFLYLKPDYPLWMFFNASQLRVMLPKLRHQIYLWYNPGEAVAHVTRRQWINSGTLDDVLETVQLEAYYLVKTPRLEFPLEELEFVEDGFAWDRTQPLVQPWHGLLKARNLTLNERLQFLVPLLNAP